MTTPDNMHHVYLQQGDTITTKEAFLSAWNRSLDLSPFYNHKREEFRNKPVRRPWPWPWPFIQDHDPRKTPGVSPPVRKTNKKWITSINYHRFELNVKITMKTKLKTTQTKQNKTKSGQDRKLRNQTKTKILLSNITRTMDYLYDIK